VLSVSFGFTAAVDTVLVPYLLRQHGIAVNRIADVVAIALIPSVYVDPPTTCPSCWQMIRVFIKFTGPSPPSGSNVGFGEGRLPVGKSGFGLCC
jgi:hypothetical protein